MISNVFYFALIYYAYFNSIYYVTSGILFMIDYYKCFISLKIQQDKISNMINVYKKSLSCVMQNTLLYTIPAFIMAGHYISSYIIPFALLKSIWDIFIGVILTEIFFYTSHAIFHNKYLYFKYHKKHHEITAPVGFSTLYMTVTDLYLGNIIPVYLPMVILNAHPYTIALWTFGTTFNAIAIAHSGFKYLSDNHDKHHKYFTKNFGLNLFMDKLFGTDY